MAGITPVTAIWGNKYSEDYVHALRAQVPGLVVLGRDVSLLSPGTYRGWWCKLEVFRPENRDLRPCLFIDIDTFVLDVTILDEFARLDLTQLWLIRGFYQPDKANSGLFIAPDTELSDAIWEKSARIDTSSHGRGHGDGDYLRGFPHRLLPDAIEGIRSYKVDKLYDDAKDARIVCFHGIPQPADTEGWAHDFFGRAVRTGSDPALRGAEGEQRP